MLSKFARPASRRKKIPGSRPTARRSPAAASPSANVSSPFPAQMVVNLRYNDHRNLALSASAANYVPYSINSVFDPYYPTGGGQCTGFPQWSRIYTRYYVDSLNVELHVVNISGATSGCEVRAFALPVPHDQVASMPVPAAITADILESQGCQFATVTFLSGGFKDAVAYLRRRLIPWRIEGYPGVLPSYNDMSSLCTADPARQPVVLLGVVSSDSLSGASKSVDIQVVLTYHVRFYAPTITFDV